MAWECRKHRWYYYQKQRSGTRVVSTYVGSGLLASSTALLHEMEQTRRADERRAAQQARHERHCRERDAAALAAQCHDLARLALLAAGYHQHKGTWRKRRTRGGTMPRTTPQPTSPNLPALPAPDDTSPEARKAIIVRCNRRDATIEDVQALRHILPHLDISDVGNTVRSALTYTVKVAADGNAWLLETAKAHIEQRRADLGYADCPALERTLIDHLLPCEGRLGMMETFVSNKTAEHVTVAQMQQVETLLESAQRRYLRAVETLAKVRRLAVPVLVQQNITIGKE